MLTAKQHYLHGRTDEARQILEDAIAEDPEDGKACLFLALIEMEQGECESARRRLEYVSGLSDEYRETVEEYYLLLLEEYEAIVWAELRPEPIPAAGVLYRFTGPIMTAQVLQSRGDWTQFTLRTWVPNDERVERYRDTPVIRVLYETPEMVYADLICWTARDMVVDHNPFRTRQGIHLSLVSLNYCPTADDDVVLVYGIVLNDGTEVVREPQALVNVIYVDLLSEMLVAQRSSGFSDPIFRALDMTMMPRMDMGQAMVPIRPRELQPGRRGIIVLTVEVPDPDLFLILEAEFSVPREERLAGR